MTSFLYSSTRGNSPNGNFRDVTLKGLAPDGGLYLPCEWPKFDAAMLRSLRDSSFQDIAYAVIAPFVAGSLSNEVLRRLIDKAWSGFDVSDIAPLREIAEKHYILELFHGPTLAFKDVALQFLGNLFEHFLSHANTTMTVLGATSGDTGSAAIAATANRSNIRTFILYPHGRTSEIQRRQMTCIDAPNVHAIAVEGTFDDCQAIVKELFSDHAFNARHNLAAVNSINWARLLAQMVYYFYAAIKLGSPDVAPSFVVPTGNFGNVFSGYAAHICGLPVSRFAVATNSNDILTRFFASGRMEAREVLATLSPSMDIQISSNFERLLFMLARGDTALVRHSMTAQKAQGLFSVSSEMLEKTHALFTAARVDDSATLQTIKRVYDKTGVIIDPHTAVGVCAADMLQSDLGRPIVTLATAHPAKFPEAIQRAIGVKVEPPEHIAKLLDAPERIQIIPATAKAVMNIIAA